MKRDEGGAIAKLGVKCGVLYNVLTDGTGESSGVGRLLEWVVNLWHRSIRLLSSGMVIRF